MRKPVFCLLCVALATASVSESFSITPSFVGARLTTRSRVLRSAADDYLETLQKDFHKFQDSWSSSGASAADVAETMIEKAIRMTGAQRDVEEQRLDAAEKKVKYAMSEEGRADAFEQEAHQAAIAAQRQVQLLESMENAYNDLERTRAMSVAHAAHHEEQDAKNMYDAAKRAEMSAREEEAEARNSLEMLRHNEMELKAELRALQQERTQREMKTKDSQGESIDVNLSAEERVETVKKEFRDLQDTLLHTQDETSLEDVALAMIEKAIKMTGAQRELETEHIAAAEEAFKHAIDDEAVAEAVLNEAHNDAVAAERQVTMLESTEDDYEDLERMRDMSVAHAAHQMEGDAKARFDAARKQEIQARDDEAEASRSLEQLEHNEAELKETLKQMQVQKMEKAVEAWKESER